MRLGKIEIDKPLLLAPMEDVTDQAFRIICKRLGADIVYTEFVNSEGLVRNSDKTKKKMFFREEERPIGIQIYGSEALSMGKAAVIAESLGPDIIDINCGCWVRNVVGAGAGSDLLRDIPRMERIISSVIKTVNVPVTIKTRIGWDPESINIIDVAKMAEQSGSAAITIHCRTRSQALKGEPDFSWISRVKSEVSIPVIANGSLETPLKIRSIFNETGCDGVMIGRGAIENPWIFSQTKHFLKTGILQSDPTIEERFRLLIEHLKLSTECKGERKGVIEFRKHYTGYLKGLYGTAKVRQELMQYVDLEPVINHLLHYQNELIMHNAQKEKSNRAEVF